MPVVVEKTIKARYVTVGDEVILLHRAHSELVADVSIPRGPNAKYASISTDYGVTKIALDNEVTVYREELTDEEKVAAARERANAWIQNEIEQTPELLARFRNKLFDDLYRDPSWHGSIWASYSLTQVMNNLWTIVADIAFARGIDKVDAVKIVAESVRKDILRNIRFTNNSTNAISNLAKGIELEAKAQWLNELEWHVDL